MDFKFVTNRAIGSAHGVFKKHGPSILTGVGVTGFVATTVLVGRAAIRSKGIIKDTKDYVDKISSKDITFEYTEKAKAKEAGAAWMETAGALAKIYGPSAALGTASIFCVLMAHGMMLKRQASLVAAYGVLDASYKAYRKRIQDELGVDKELELYRKPRFVESVNEAGETCEIIDYNDVMPSVYSRFFDESSAYWSKDSEYNLVFLRSQQSYLNDRLRAHGFVFLNEVYETLGLERSQAGQVVGWKFKRNTENDGYIDFGIYDISDECNRAFVNGLEHTVLLDFNVDGPIKI